MSFSIKWADLKTLKNANSWQLYYIEQKNLAEVVDSYIVVTGNVNNQYHTKCQLTDKTDFETNFKSASTKVDLIPEAISQIEEVGKTEIVQITPFSSNAVEFKGKGVKGTATKEATTDIDLKITEGSLINGGLLYTNNAVVGDKFTCQVVDKDGIYYPAGTVLNEWITNWYAMPNTKMDLTTPQAGAIPANVYLRIKYTSIGTVNDVDVIVNYKLNKDLI